MALLAQVYCPHNGSLYHRLLHVYCCCHPACWSKSERYTFTILFLSPKGNTCVVLYELLGTTLIFFCSWLVLRSQQKDPSYEMKQKEEQSPSAATFNVANTQDTAREWCEDLDDWGDETGVSEEEAWNAQNTSNPLRNVRESLDVECSQVEELMKSMSVHEASDLIETQTTSNGALLEETSVAIANSSLPVETKTPSLYKGPYYPASYIAVVEEPETLGAGDHELLKKYESDHPFFDFTMTGLAAQQKARKKESGHHKSRRKEKDGYSKDGASGSGEMYEKGVAKHGDKAFQKFHKQLSKCPQQILRYVTLFQNFMYDIIVFLSLQILMEGEAPAIQQSSSSPATKGVGTGLQGVWSHMCV